MQESSSHFSLCSAFADVVVMCIANVRRKRNDSRKKRKRGRSLKRKCKVNHPNSKSKIVQSVREYLSILNRGCYVSEMRHSSSSDSDDELPEKQMPPPQMPQPSTGYPVAPGPYGAPYPTADAPPYNSGPTPGTEPPYPNINSPLPAANMPPYPVNPDQVPPPTNQPAPGKF